MKSHKFLVNKSTEFFFFLNENLMNFVLEKFLRWDLMKTSWVLSGKNSLGRVWWKSHEFCIWKPLRKFIGGNPFLHKLCENYHFLFLKIIYRKMMLFSKPIAMRPWIYNINYGLICKSMCMSKNVMNDLSINGHKSRVVMQNEYVSM